MSDSTSVWHKLYNGETRISFIPRWRLWFALSGVVIAIGVASLVSQGLNLGIEFEGGVSWQVPAGDASVDGMRGAVEDAGLADATVQTVGTGSGERLRIKAELQEGQDPVEIAAAIAEEAGVDADEVTQQTVSKSWGDQITSKAQRALIVFLVLVSLYIAFRFEWKMALATLLALLHDILVTVGVYSLFSFEVTPATVIAILTILGYSIYDGIVVFDRIDENAKALAVTGDRTYSTMVNDSMNQVLMRTLNTSITALLPILSLLVLGSLVLGATTLQEFALALFIGLASGAYSSIFIASPALALLKEREERWRTVRQRVERLGGRVPAPAPVAAAPVARDADDAEEEISSIRQASREQPTARAIQARGRKKQRRR
ncbi:MAG TPA: protein translocase subunit SecF [Acidimicrobiales bacterium]|nr:protein translocase subunit SecF [Acidimicrobiales bacterium]